MVSGRILVAAGERLTVHHPVFSLQLASWDLVPLAREEDTLKCLSDVDVILFEVTEAASRRVLRLVRSIRKHCQHIPIVFVSLQSSERLLIEALRHGVSDYYKWPLDSDEFARGLRRLAREYRTLASTPAARSVEAEGHGESGRLIGGSAVMEEINANIARIARTDSNVLITGETGTGKELVGELLYRGSPRGDKPFVCINCAAIPDSLLESELFGHEKGSFTGANACRDGQLMHAHNGTIFLDEIGDMSLRGQAKILRAIETKRVQRVGSNESRPVNVRVIAATNQNLEHKLSEGRFRKDLFFRLNVARIHLPPLRQRKEDIDLLSRHFIRQFNGRFGLAVRGLSDEVLAHFIQYPWPGNVRELRNVIEASFINEPGTQICPTDLPAWFRLAATAAQGENAGTEEERDKVLAALLSTNWNKSKAAKRLNWSRMTLYRKMHKYHIEDNKLKAQRRSEMV